MPRFLAQLQAEVALGALLGLDDLRLDGEPEWNERMVIRGLRRLPIAFRAR